jgi:hypothetical protein
MNPFDNPPTEGILFKAILRDEPDFTPLWTPEELGDVLAHQLQVPLEEDLDRLDPAIAAALRAQPLGGHKLNTFGDLLRHPRPPSALLDGLKRFGKLHRHRESPAIGPSIATLLYYAAVLLARVRLDKRITAMNDTQIIEGVRWSLAQPWVDAETHAILQEALMALESPGNGACSSSLTLRTERSHPASEPEVVPGEP